MSSLDDLSILYRQDETTCINNLLSQAALPADSLQRIQHTAEKLVLATRKERKKQAGIATFLHQYDLSSEEGVALMCLAEALLRTPDKATIDRLISDKISTSDWINHLNSSDSLFVNAATWALMLTGKIYAPHLTRKKSLTASLTKLLSRLGSTVLRPIILQGMKIVGKQFVMGTTIEEALQNGAPAEAMGYRYSYDMLGESARTQADAEKYLHSYITAIHAIGKKAQSIGPIKGPGISIKLSALHPRYEYTQRERALAELAPCLLELAKLAKQYNIGLTVDAEEADRLELSLEIFQKVFTDPALAGWEGFGLAVQSYQKRAPAVIDYLAGLAKDQQRRIMVRLIKGAYWDAEIKQSQLQGLSDYPVFTRKSSTDVSFIACARKILALPDCFYPQFGTHNAYSVATILELTGFHKDYEFQCLHGMGQPLYNNIIGPQHYDVACRIYAPVGTHKDLLGYLVRRLLENGANTSFIKHIDDETIPIARLIQDPVARLAALTHKPHPRIPLPQHLFASERVNSKGIDLSDGKSVESLLLAMDQAATQNWVAAPIISGKSHMHMAKQAVVSPADPSITVGYVSEATLEDVELALSKASAAITKWSMSTVDERAVILEKAADLFEQFTPTLMSLLTREAGKQIPDSISEIREAVDFCRYYALRARNDLKPTPLPGPTGEYNELSFHSRGVIACISPWNFPLAIFIGQVTAALAAGNTVIAKPAEQTPLIGAFAVQLLHEAGIPQDVLHLLPGRGEIVGAKLIADNRIAGVMFTGSTETAKIINQTLAARSGSIVPLIAETGGQNAMIVDSSALPEQVVSDIIQSAFNSAGQRCSALRVLFVQDSIAPRLLEMLQGAMQELIIGNPANLATDVGPVIDKEALDVLEKHAAAMQDRAKLLYQVPMPDLPSGYFFAPCVFELDNLNILTREVFGPILHVIRFRANELDKVMEQIINTSYGLTLGIHSRIDATIEYIRSRMPVGNIYVNRNMIGAVVGVQPFGGEQLSGTGPKAGGPHYLPRLCVERVVSINTTAAGGNTTLVSLAEDEEE